VNEFVLKHFSCDDHFLLFAYNCPQDSNSEIESLWDNKSW